MKRKSYFKSAGWSGKLAVGSCGWKDEKDADAERLPIPKLSAQKCIRAYIFHQVSSFTLNISLTPLTSQEYKQTLWRTSPCKVKTCEVPVKSHH